MNAIEQAALKYLKLGLHPIPLRMRSKIPPAEFLWKDFQTIPPTPSQIHEWFGDGDANVAIILGRGFIALDFDGPGAESLLARKGVTIPPHAPRSLTARGCHVILREWKIVNDAIGLVREEKSQVDLRAVGYIVAPPSIHPDGHRYKWQREIGDSIPTAPTSLVHLVETQTADAAIAWTDERDLNLIAHARSHGRGWISVNRFGAVCLNSLRVFFGDIDCREPDEQRRRSLATFDEANETIDRVATENNLTFRVYRTRAGLRVIETSRLFDPLSHGVVDIFRKLGCDAKYMKCTKEWKNFRSRLTPKPWRSHRKKMDFRAVDNDLSGHLSTPKWAVAKFLRIAGSIQTENNAEIDRIVHLHDDYCQSHNSDLPLA